MRKINYDKYSEVYENEDYFVGRYASNKQFFIKSKIYEQSDKLSPYFDILAILTTISNNYDKQLPVIVDELNSEYYEQMLHKEDYHVGGLWVAIKTTYTSKEYQVVLRSGKDVVGVGSYKYKKNALATEKWLHECLSQIPFKPFVLERIKNRENNPLERIVTIKPIGGKIFKEKYDPKPKFKPSITEFRTGRNGGLILKGHLYPVSVTDYLKAILIFKNIPNSNGWVSLIKKQCIKNELTLNDWIDIYEAYNKKELNKTFTFFDSLFRKGGYIQGHRFHEDCVTEYEKSDYLKE